MESATQAAATLLMGLFALGVIGCAITIPVCAARFFAILFEGTAEQQTMGDRLVPVYENAAAPSPASTPEAPPADVQPPPRAHGAAAGSSQK